MVTVFVVPSQPTFAPNASAMARAGTIVLSFIIHAATSSSMLSPFLISCFWSICIETLSDPLFAIAHRAFYPYGAQCAGWHVGA